MILAMPHLSGPYNLVLFDQIRLNFESLSCAYRYIRKESFTFHGMIEAIASCNKLRYYRSTMHENHIYVHLYSLTFETLFCFVS